MGDFHANLRRLRIDAGISGKDFASRIGAPYSSYMNYENKSNEPKYELLCRIADVLGVSTDELLGHTTHFSRLAASDPYLDKLCIISTATAKAVAEAMGINTDTASDAKESRFDDLKKLMSDAQFFICFDDKAEPDVKLGRKITIVREDQAPTSDFENRMYLLIPRVWQGCNHAAMALFIKRLRLLYDDDFRQRTNAGGIDPDWAVVQLYLGLFNQKIEPLDAGEIDDILSGKVPNPLINNMGND